MKHALEERLTILLAPTEKELLRELAYLRRETMGSVVRALIRDEVMQSGIVLPKPAKEQEAELLKAVQ
jgi:hypothetical protein